MSLEIRSISASEVRDFRRSLIRTFGADPEDDPKADSRLLALLELSRTYAAFEEGAMVATSAAFDLALTVPGGSLPMGGFTMASVRETHRRRGLLRSMLEAHFEDAQGRGDALSGLWASEASIYGRFGYGLATESDHLEVVGLELAGAPAQDEVELVAGARAAELLPPLYDRVCAERPGMFARSAAWWEHRIFHDAPHRRQGASQPRHVIALRDGAVTGYVSYRQRPAWEDGRACGSIEIVELLAADLRAEATLWRLVSSIDLFPRVTHWNAPVDTSLPWLAADRRRVKRRRGDALWLRICDVAGALGGRSYGGEGTLRLAVEDEFLPDQSGVYELRAEGGTAECARVERPAQLHLDVSALSSLYLGGAAPSLLARAGRLRADPSALALADRLFAAPVAPWCQEVF